MTQTTVHEGPPKTISRPLAIAQCFRIDFHVFDKTIGIPFTTGRKHHSAFRNGRFQIANPMNAALAGLSFAHSRPFPAVFVGGVIAGALDLAYAIAVHSPRKPIFIAQFVASGLLGLKAFSGGTTTAVLGVILHFTIALGAATVYYLASRKPAFLVKRAVLAGLIYGALVYAFMHIVVLPLSAVPKGPTHFIYQAFEFVWHWFGVGLPIALSVRTIRGVNQIVLESDW